MQITTLHSFFTKFLCLLCADECALVFVQLHTRIYLTEIFPLLLCEKNFLEGYWRQKIEKWTYDKRKADLYKRCVLVLLKWFKKSSMVKKTLSASLATRCLLNGKFFQTKWPLLTSQLLSSNVPANPAPAPNLLVSATICFFMCLSQLRMLEKTRAVTLCHSSWLKHYLRNIDLNISNLSRCLRGLNNKLGLETLNAHPGEICFSHWEWRLWYSWLRCEYVAIFLF